MTQVITSNEICHRQYTYCCHQPELQDFKISVCMETIIYIYIYILNVTYCKFKTKGYIIHMLSYIVYLKNYV